MKYRYLTFQELDLLSEDFNEFLYQEGINSFEWNVLQDQQSSDALNLLEKYSDITFERILQDIQYLNYRSDKEIVSFECQTDKMVIIRLKSTGKNNLDLTNFNELSQIQHKGMLTFKCSKSINAYAENRESDIFKLIESGCIASDPRMFKSLSIIRKSYEN